MLHQHQPASSLSAGPVDRAPDSAIRVCVALFRWSGSDLETALTDHGMVPWALPSPDEPLETTAKRIIREWGCVEAQYVEQLYTFSQLDHGTREIVISYLGLFSPETFATADPGRLTWLSASLASPTEEIDRMVLDYALVRLRAKLGYTNIAFNLVPRTFTLSELQQAYESILGQPMDKRNFRRRLIASGILTKTNQTRREGSHRPAALYRFSEHEDQATYLTPPWQSES